MRIASVPFNEKLRLQDLYSFDILDSDREKEYDDLLEVAAHIYGCPIAAISFVDNERQWFKSTKGLPDGTVSTPRNVSFCTYTILGNDVLIVQDATKDERFCNYPLVTDDLAIRFYAGAPILSSSGYRLGSICVLDIQPRELTQKEAKMLNILSRQISVLLELRMKNKVLRQKAEEQLHLEKLLLQKTLHDHEVEKQSISSELHENIAQTLAATKFFLEMAEESSADMAGLVRKSKENIISLVKQVRELSQSITPSLLPEVDLHDLLRELLSRFYNNTGTEVKLIYESRGFVASAIALTAYRILEVQLENIRQHAKATVVTVNINAFSTFHLSIKDNGVGFVGKTFRKGGGLSKVLLRVEALNGRVEINAGVNGGCELVVAIPQ